MRIEMRETERGVGGEGRHSRDFNLETHYQIPLVGPVWWLVASIMRAD